MQITIQCTFEFTDGIKSANTNERSILTYVRGRTGQRFLLGSHLFPDLPALPPFVIIISAEMSVEHLCPLPSKALRGKRTFSNEITGKRDAKLKVPLIS